MKRNQIIIGLLCLLLMATGCDQSAPDVSEPVAYRLYMTNSTLDMVDPGSRFAFSATEGVTVGQMDELQFSFVGETVSGKTPENEKTVTVGGTSYRVVYRESQRTQLFQSKHVFQRESAVTNRYVYRFPNTVEDEVIVDFRESDGLISFYSVLSESIRKTLGNLTEDEALETAKTVVNELYGAQVLSDYEKVTVSESSSQFMSGYSVTFRRVLYGYDCEDYILIRLNRKGEVINIHAKTFGLMTPYLNDLTSEQIEDAKKVLQDAIPEGVYYSNDGMLRVNQDGGLYFSGYARREGENKFGNPHSSFICYVNII